MDGKVFWKSSRFKKLTPEKVGNVEYCFSWKIDASQKYLFQKSSSSANVFILDHSLSKKVPLPKSNCPNDLPILKKLSSNYT